MALSLCPRPDSPAFCSPHSRISHHHVHGAGAHFLGPIANFFRGGRSLRWPSIAASPQHHSLFLSASLGGEGRSNSCRIRSRKATTAAQKRQASFQVLCSSSLQGGPTAEEPDTENRKGPRVQWTLLVAGVAAAGVLIFLRLQGGSSATLGTTGQALALQAEDPGFAPAVLPVQYNVKVPGLGNLSLGEFTPGWVYFLLLMAAGFGLFVSEEALNVWVGSSLSRLLSYGSKEAFWTSLSANGSHIIATILWVYWGVCISDMVPFYAGRLASRSGDQISQKLGVSKEKHEQVTGNIQRYGNLIGFVERFSLGVRNPTSFLAGFVGISPVKFFAGVCVGGLFTLPIQLSIGYVFRERPVAALAGVAAVVGIWTIFPYAAAGSFSLYYLIQRFTKKPSE